jgi:hypothetical protein
MTPEQIQKMAEGCPPSAIGKDHEEVITWLAEKHIALQEQVQKLAALAEERRVFIVNGAEMGYIQLPVFDDDPATSTYQRCLLKPKFAADAVIREVGAKAVDEVVKFLGGLTSDECGDSAYIGTVNIAAKLRNGG